MEQVFNSMTLVLLLAFGASSGIQAWIEGGIIVFNLMFHADAEGRENDRESENP
jgi:hypothetical protein